jgi:general stress protein CsbA
VKGGGKEVKMKSKIVGKWAFIVGLIVAILASFLSGYAATTAVVLFLLGLVVGFLNISEKDSNKFLLAAIAMLTVELQA